MRLSRRALVASGAVLPMLRCAQALAAPKDLLIFGLSGYPASLAVWSQVGTSATTVKLLTHRGLLSFDAKGELRGELAESWAPRGSNGWEFRLREAKFATGARVTAADVRWTLEQLPDARHAAYYRGVFADLDRIETPDDRTVVIYTKAPLVTLPLIMAMPHMMIVPAGAVAERGQLPPGAGPYVLKAQERGVALEFERSEHYYRPGLPRTPRVRMVAYADETLRVAALKSGDVDIIEYVPWQSMGMIEADPTLKMDQTFGPFMYLTFNGQAGPFTNPLLRQAVAFGVRRDDVVNAAFFGRGAPLGGLPIVKESPYYDEATANHWTYDPARVKALLAQAGVPGGFSCKLLSNAQFTMHRSTAEVVQQSLASVGIAVDLQLPDYATYTTLGNRGQYEMALVGNVSDYNDPDGLASLIDGSLPVSFVRSFNLNIPELHDNLVLGRQEADAAKRKAIYAKVVQIALEKAPIVGLAWRAQAYAMKAKVSGFASLPGQLTFFSGMTLEDTSIEG